VSGPEVPEERLPSDEDDRAAPGVPPPTVLSPREVLRLVLPAFAVSTVLAVIGVVLVLSGQRTIGLVLVVVAAVGGLLYRGRRLAKAQQARGGR
jgi:hypothetical protein